MVPCRPVGFADIIFPEVTMVQGVWRLSAAVFVVTGLWLSACSTSDQAAVSEVPESGLGVGAPCLLNSECRPPLGCVAETCQPLGETPEGGTCWISAECADGLYCDATRSACALAGANNAGAPCRTSAECLPALVCAPQGFSAACTEGGTLDIGEECHTSADCLAGLGCNSPLTEVNAPRQCLSGPEGLPLPFAGVQCERQTDPATKALFEVPREGVESHFYALPFPNDVRLVNGHPDLSGHPTPGDDILGYDVVQRYIDVIGSEQDHFGVNPTVFFRFDGRIDYETVLAGGEDPNLFFVDLTPTSPDYGQPRSLFWQASTAAGRYICENWISMRPPWGRPLAARHTYAAVLKTTITAEGGGALAQDADLSVMLNGADPGGELTAAWQSYAPLRAWVADRAIDPRTLLDVAVFTTGDPLALTAGLRETVRTHDPVASELTLCNEGVVSPCDDGLEREVHVRGCFEARDGFSEIQGKISLPIVQEGEAPYRDEGGAMSLDGGRPAITRTEDVCMAMTVPDGAAPEGGWPVLIVAHGTGGSYRGFAGQLSPLVSAMDLDGTPTGMLVIGWDQVEHFRRRGASLDDPEGLVYNFANPHAAMGNVYQGAADLFAIVKYVESLNLSAEDSPTGQPIVANPNQIYFFGHSQGSTSGSIALPFEPAIKGAILSGAGAGLSLSLLSKTSPVDIPTAVKVVLQDLDVFESHPVMSLIQQYFDPVDPLNYAEYIAAHQIEGETSPHHVLHSMGIGDTYTPMITLETMATALRLTLALPLEQELDRGFVAEADLPISGNMTVGGEPFTVVGRQYTPIDYDGHFVFFREPRAQDDLVEFLGTAILRGVPEIAD